MIEQQTILDLIETIYLCGSGNADWHVFLDQYGRLFPALKLALTGYDYLFSNLEVFCTANFDSRFIDDYIAHYHKMNPWQNGVMSAPLAPKVAWADDMVSSRDLERTEFYADWVRPQEDIATGFSTTLVKEKDRFFNLAANANRNHMETAQAAARTIALIGPHLRRSFELHRQLLGARVQEETYQSVLDTLLAAVFVVDADARLRFCNARAEHLLQQERIVKCARSSRLCFIDARDHRAVMESVRRAAMRCDRDGDLTIPLHAGSAQRSQCAFVTALTTQRRGLVRESASLSSPSSVAVFIIDPHELPSAKVEAIAKGLKVTPAEARLALALLYDNTLKRYASENGLSVHTARNQLRSLLEKTGTHRQANLVRRLMSVFGTFNFG